MFGSDGDMDAVQPLLQAQDGSFIGTVVVGNDANNNPLSDMASFDQTGAIRWVVPGNYQPQIATADGGLIATDPSGAAITFDQYGSATGVLPNLPIPSWTGAAYQLGSVDRVLSPPVSVATTLWAFQEANESADDTAAQQGLTLNGPTPVKTTYNGTPLLDCNGAVQTNPLALTFFGYQECESYTVFDKGNPPKQIVRAGIAFDEQMDIVATNMNSQHSQGNGNTNDKGILVDDLNLGTNVAPPQPGQYIVKKQTITLHSTGVTVRVNCLDYEATDVTVTDITSAPNAACTRNQ